jgi:membrane protein YdbS with pleckstrin-like domain
MAGEWYLLIGGKKRGPLTAAQLHQLAKQGDITPASQVARNPDGPWVPANRVKGLFSPSSLDSANVAPSAHAVVPSPPNLLQTPGMVPSSSVTDEERFIWQGRPSQIVNLCSFIVCGLLFWLILPLFFALWRWLEVRCTKYELTSQRLRLTRGVLARRIEDVELYRIKDITFDQPVMLRIFSLANIQLSSSDLTSPQLVLQALSAEDALQLRETMRTHVECQRARKRVREIDFFT